MAEGKEPLGVVWPVWRVSMGLRGLKGLSGLKGLKGLKGWKRLEGASGSFGPVEKERLGWPQPLVLQQKRNHWACHSLKFGSSKSRFGMFGGV